MCRYLVNLFLPQSVLCLLTHWLLQTPKAVVSVFYHRLRTQLSNMMIMQIYDLPSTVNYCSAFWWMGLSTTTPMSLSCCYHAKDVAQMCEHLQLISKWPDPSCFLVTSSLQPLLAAHMTEYEAVWLDVSCWNAPWESQLTSPPNKL